MITDEKTKQLIIDTIKKVKTKAPIEILLKDCSDKLSIDIKMVKEVWEENKNKF
jgi:hypothetical protein